MQNIFKSKAALFASASLLAGLASPHVFAQGNENIVVTAQRQAYVGDIPVADIPQSVQTISSDTLKITGVTRMDAALDLVSGVSHLNNFGGLWDSYAIRGFSGDANNLPSGFLVNGFNGARGFGGPRDTSSVERIDVLKGPTSALFGRGEPGGTVNIVTKKPEFREKGYIQLTGGSWNFYRVEADYTSPLSETVAFRINGAYEDAKSYRDTIHTRKIFLTPSLLWKMSDTTSISYEMEFAHLEIPFDRGIPIYNKDFTRLPASRYLGEPGDGPMKIDVWGNQLQLQHDFSDTWSFLAGASYRTTRLAGIGEYPELVSGRQPFLNGKGYVEPGRIVSRQRRWGDSRSRSFIARAELTGHHEFGSVENTLVIGVDYDWFRLDQVQKRFRPPSYSGQSLAAINGIDVFNPVYGAYPLPDAQTSMVYDRLERDNSWGAYFYDQIDLTGWLKVRVGGRYDEFKQNFLNRVAANIAKQNVSKFSPQAGIVVQPTETISLYGSYGRGFRPNNGQDFSGNNFEPETSKSYEVGAKYSSPDKRINASVALYDMRKTNILTSDPNPDHSGFVIAAGSARSKGVEFDLNARLPYGFTLIAAYAYTDAYWTSQVLDADFGYTINKGDPLLNVAKHGGNVLLTNEFEIGDGHKATIGAGVQYIGRRLGETAVDYYLPSATLVKLLAAVDLTDKLRISGNIDNLFDKRWFSNSYSAMWTFPGAPRSFRVNATYNF